jgi:hypothetical protein
VILLLCLYLRVLVASYIELSLSLEAERGTSRDISRIELHMLYQILSLYNKQTRTQISRSFAYSNKKMYDDDVIH